MEIYEWSPSENERIFMPDTWAYFNSYEKDEPLPEPKEIKYLKSESIKI